MTDTLARVLAGLALVVGLVAGAISLSAANQPVELGASHLKFSGGVDVSGQAATPGIVLRAVATGVPVIRVLNAAGTEIANLSSSGVLIAPAPGITPTP